MVGGYFEHDAPKQAWRCTVPIKTNIRSAAPPARPLCPGRAIPGYAVLEGGQGLFGVHDAGIIIPCGVEEAGELSGRKRGVQ